MAAVVQMLEFPMKSLPSRSSSVSAGWAIAAIAGLLVLRFLFLARHGVDSDETQHLHVIYGWLRGELPYRDQFDNHTPLFAWLFLPFARLAGETPNVVLFARLAQIPLSFGVVALFYGLARRLADRTTALWATAFTLALADWSLKALEFRPDVLWTALWLGALWVLAIAKPGWRSFLPAGLLLGAALMASVKTVFLLAGLGLGWLGAWVLCPEFRQAYTPRRIVECALAGAAGFTVVPAAFLGGFAANGALEAMRYCLFTVNVPESPAVWRSGLFAAGAVVALGLAWRMHRTGGNGMREAVFLAAAFYALLVVGFSPSLKKQTFLPAYPLLILVAVDVLRLARWRPWIPAAACMGLLVHQFLEAAPWRDGMAAQRELLRAVLAITRPGEPVLDVKGETVFRPRPLYFVFVQATMRGIDQGRLPQPDLKKLAASGTPVAIGGGAGFPDALRKYVKDHYAATRDGLLRVAGGSLDRNGALWQAELPVAGDYVLLTRRGELVSTVRIPASGVQMLEAGEGRVLYWKRAWDAGCLPATRD
jgi:4-amino-4-deoxy-L-arabinose transferase-like glycosyltransferase